MISREQIEELFQRTRKLHREGRASWDIDGTCRWSYFFVDSSRDKLTRLGKHLEGLAYEFVGFLEPSPEDKDQETIYLRVDRVEAQSVDTLLARNAEFYALARRFQVANYDGMDVGAVDGP